MFGEPQPPSEVPSTSPAIPFPSNQDPRAMLAYAEAMTAHAKYMQLVAPQQHQALSMPAALAHVPQPSVPKPQAGASSQKRAAAGGAGPSLFTIVVTLIIGAAGGAMCNQQLAQQQQQQPTQQLSRQ